MTARTIAAGVAGGLVAGAMIGVAEALASWASTHGVGELPPIAWALVAYGALGALAGAGVGLAARLLSTDGFALGLAATGAVLGIVVGRFRVIRDVFLEQAPHGALAFAVQIACVLGVVLVSVGVWWMLRGAQSRGRWLTRPAVAVAVILAFALGWAAVARPGATQSSARVPARAAAPAGAPNLILVMVDTLRADRVPAYGYTKGRTPTLDALTSGGIRFANAFAQASWTRPSVATMLTGLYPSSHGAVHKPDMLPDRVETLPELLAAAGYRTVGFANNVNVTAAFGFAQGYDEYRYLAPGFFFWADEPAAKLALYNVLRLVRERFFSRHIDVHNYYQPGEVVTQRVREWLTRDATVPEPFFLFVHYMDPHDPYFVHPYNGEGYARVAYPNPPAKYAERFSRLYDGEITYFDEHLGALLDALRTRGVLDRTLIAVTGDHGEEFYEHGGWWHGTTLYDEQLHVPLIIKGPAGGASGRVVEELVTHLDIAPTFLAAAGLPIPSVMQGHALPLDGQEAPDRDRVFAEENFEGNVLEAVRRRGWKLITANPANPRGLPVEELFDVAQDPGEQRNLVADNPPPLTSLRAELGRAVIEARTHAGAAEQRAIDDVTRERLRSLGYVN